MANAAVSFFVNLSSGDEVSNASPPKSARGRIKAMQCKMRNTLMQFPGARRLACRKRLTKTTSFLKEHGANENELCICLYVIGYDLPEKLEFMTKDRSLTFPKGSPLLAEYFLKDEPVRVQIMKYDVKLGCLSPPENKIGGWKKSKNKAVSFIVNLDRCDEESKVTKPTSAIGHVKAIQCSKRNILMKFPGARRLACRKRLRNATSFLKERGVDVNEFCICLYVIGSQLPERFELMSKDSSYNCPSGSALLAEYLLDDENVRVQIMKYKAELDCLAPPTNKIGGWKKFKHKAVSFFVNLNSGDEGSDVSSPTSVRGRVKAMQRSKRSTFMHFPGARRLACRNRLRRATSFLKEEGANVSELCICLYVTGSELPDKFEFMSKHSSLTCPSGSPLLAEYFLVDESIRVQIMKYEVKLDCLAPPVNKIGGWKKRIQKAVSFFVNVHSGDEGSDVSPPTSARGQIKSIQCMKRRTLMQFPGARRLACRKRLSDATSFLKEQGATQNELCICLYVTGSELPEKFEIMTKDCSLLCPSESPLLAEYLLNDEPVRVQVLKFEVKLGCLAPPLNKIGGLKKTQHN